MWPFLFSYKFIFSSFEISGWRMLGTGMKYAASGFKFHRDVHFHRSSVFTPSLGSFLNDFAIGLSPKAFK